MSSSLYTIKKTCEWCGREFQAQKVTTRFCCKQCNQRAYKAGLRKAQVADAVQVIESRSSAIREGQEYFSVKQTAQLVGISSRGVYNLIYRGQLKASRLSSRLTIIRKSDIEAMLSGHGYTKTSKKTDSPITEFYCTQEVLDKFGISNGWLFKVAKEKGIPRVFKMGKTWWSKTHIDRFFSKEEPDSSIIEWYSTAEMMEKFNMTFSAVYTFVSAHRIPKKKVKKQVFYSRKHVDIAKGIREPDKPQYYTMKEAMEKFGLTRDQIYHYTKAFAVPKVMEGKYVKYSKEEMDAALAPPEIP